MPFPTGKLLLPGFEEDPESAVLRTEMEDGPAKQAQIKSRVMVGRPVTYRYTATEYAAFKVWFRDDVARGTSWWSWTDPLDGLVKQARIVNGKYKGVPTKKAEGAPLEWLVSFNLETWEN